ncbi:MAG: TetR/AcrR family transcriptional regulator [Actinomycetota bacterium]|nr:TetR/AcrR family transcriptional regulator [Actinomycetota bacterium]
MGRLKTDSNRRPRAKRGQGTKLRDEVLDVAEKLLLEAGDPEAVSVRAIAAAASCTPPSIYLHFADKDELFSAVCERRFAEFERYAEAAAAGTDDPLESLRLRAKAYVRFGLDRPQQYRLLMVTPKRRSPDELPGPSTASAVFQHLVDAVQVCIDTGAFPADPGPRPMALVLWAAIHGLTSLLITFPNLAWGDHDELVELMLDVQLEGLLAV